MRYFTGQEIKYVYSEAEKKKTNVVFNFTIYADIYEIESRYLGNSWTPASGM